ncbi:MAG: OmpA family protein [Mariprofundaceae bacterium]
MTISDMKITAIKSTLPATAMLITLLALGGCISMPGGHCEYQTSVELAHLEKTGDDFNLILSESHMNHFNLAYPFDKAVKQKEQVASARNGDVWHIVVQEQTKGTCTPLWISVFQQVSADVSDYSVYFSADSSIPSPAEKNMIGAFAQRHQGCQFQIEGHSDETGAREYNLHLGQRMADSVAQIMQNNGIAKGQMETISFGEERPQTARASADKRHALNRRAHIIARCEQN